MNGLKMFIGTINHNTGKGRVRLYALRFAGHVYRIYASTGEDLGYRGDTFAECATYVRRAYQSQAWGLLLGVRALREAVL